MFPSHPVCDWNICTLEINQPIINPSIYYSGSCFIYVICIYLCLLVFNTIPYHMMFESFISNTTGATSGAETVNASAT